MRNVLVTGGAGFMGSNFIRFLLEVEPQVHVINLDLLTYAGSLANLEQLPDPKRHTFIHGDVCDRDLVAQLFQTHRIDTVVHFAAETHVDRSIADPTPFMRTNVQGTMTLLSAARTAWCAGSRNPDGGVRFHHISTDEVYGSLNSGQAPPAENARYAPTSPYAASKAASDHLVQSYWHTYGLPTTITNTSNNYGPRQYPEKLIPLAIHNAIGGRPIPLYGDGLQKRDWLHVDDHSKAVLRVLRRGCPGDKYNVSSGIQLTNLVLVRSLCGVLDNLLPDRSREPCASLIRFVEDRPSHDELYAMDVSKVKEVLDWEPSVFLEEGLKETVRWYMDHQDWLQEIWTRQDYRAWLKCNYEARGC